ncbi:MAG: hypothetical protein OXL37_00025 [Chloroflexota bacterium]|nr:hypothetical protein [Chloroflexota bacterium]MDE2959379.1 hypothetical protein [Chloroflexota bacterium]
MTEQEYAECARKFLADSDREFAAGERQQASEKLYGAANEALTAIAVRRGWNHRTHRDMKLASHQLAEEYNEPFLACGFVVAEKFRDNSIYDDMEEYEIAVDRPAAREYVYRLLKLLED